MVRYKDINFNMQSHPITNDLSIKTDIDAIKQSLKNLIMMKPYDKPMHPEIYGIYDLLFEPLDNISKFAAKKRIEDLIDKYEPRVELETIDIEDYPNENGIRIILKFYILNVNQLETIDMFIERKR